MHGFAAIAGGIREKIGFWAHGEHVLTTGRKKFYQHTVTLSLSNIIHNNKLLYKQYVFSSNQTYYAKTWRKNFLNIKIKSCSLIDFKTFEWKILIVYFIISVLQCCDAIKITSATENKI